MINIRQLFTYLFISLTCIACFLKKNDSDMELINEDELINLSDSTLTFDSTFVDVCGGSAFIPSFYIKDSELRVSLYKRLSLIDCASSLDVFAGEMKNRFGPLPGPVDLLIRTHAVRLLCFRVWVSSVSLSADLCSIVFLPTQGFF